MHAYLIALEIEPVEVNKVYVALPLHCTVVHWFRSDESPATVLKAIMEVTHAQPPIEITSAEPDMFGLLKDVPVNRIVQDAAIREFHAALHKSLVQSIAITDVEPQWVDPNFIPHVTRQRSGRFEQGRSTTARILYLVEALEPDLLQQKKVTAKLYLGKSV